MTSPEGQSATEPRIELACVRCGRRLRRRARDAGRMIQCPACGGWVMVPPLRRARPSEAPAGARGADVLVITHEDLADLPAVAARREAAVRRRHSARPPPRETRLRARHVGKKCPYCLSPIKPQGEMAVCPECGIPHHPECWEENGGCTTWGCRATPHRLPQPVPVGPPAGGTGFEVLNRTYQAPRRGSPAQGCATGCFSLLAVGILVVVLLAVFGRVGSPGAIVPLLLVVFWVLRLLGEGKNWRIWD